MVSRDLKLEKSFIDALRKSVEYYPNKTALIDSSREVTYLQLWNKILKTRCQLRKLGLNPKDRIAFIQSNSIDFIIIHIAIIANESISIPIEIGAKKETVEKIIKASGAKKIYIERKYTNLYQSESSAISDRASCLQDLLQDSETIELESADITDFNHSSENTSVILYTSGSTGLPKGVKLSQKNTLITIRNIKNFCSYSSESFEVITLPLSHSFGLGHVYAMLFSGGGAYLADGLVRIKKVLTAIRENKATGFPTTPAGVDLIMNSYAELFKQSATHLSQMVVNSAPLTPEQTHKLHSLLPNVKIYVYYGMTEASRTSFACLTELGSKYFKSVGKPMDTLKVKIDPKTSEIIISGPSLSSGYWPEDNFPTDKHKNPIIRSGDKGKFDENGYLYITGRIKDQINIGGYKVDPLEIETLLRKIEEVDNVAIYGDQSLNSTDQIICFVVFKGNKYDIELIEDFCRENLEHYKFPSEIIPIKKIPEGVNGKIDRKKLGEIYNNHISENKKLLN